MEKVTSVKIFNREYNIRSEAESEYIQKLASLLDGKMRRAAERTSSADALKLAILAGLELADECLQVNQRLEALELEVSRRSDRCSEILDKILGGTE